jgi:protein-disulfide isomerase
MNRVGWIIFSVIVVLVLGGLIAWARIANPPVDLSGFNNNSIIAAAEQNGNIADHTKGSATNEIILVEYGDYQCPSCGGAHPNLNTLMEEYGDDITFVFRNFPLTAIHPNALTAAAAAEAAGLQGKFWEMHDMLYENQSDWSNADTSRRTSIFSGYASSLGLDSERFSTDLAGRTVTQKVNFDMALGRSVGTSATPTFFLNGEKLSDEAANGIVQGDLAPIRAQLDALIEQN